MTAVFDTTSAPYTPDGIQDTITVTLPVAPGTGGTGGILTGTGFISECTLPSAETGGLMEQTITFVFDGDTGPTFTAGVAGS